MPLGTFSEDDLFSLVSGFILLESAGLGLRAPAFEACFGAVLMGSGLGFCDFSLGVSGFFEDITGSEALGCWGFVFGASGTFVGFCCTGI